MRAAEMENEQLFRTVPVQRAVMALALPTVISQLITVIYNMADTFFIGQMGDPNQVAAATLAMPVFIFLTAFANLFGIGGASLISRSLGVDDRDRVRRCSSFCVWSALAVSALYGVAVILLRTPLVRLLGADHATGGYCASYIFWTVGIGAAPTVLNAVLGHLLRSEGYSRQASFGIAFGGILNIILDPIFIFLLDMQITGAAIATMLSNLAATAYFVLFIVRSQQVLTIQPSPRFYTLRHGIPMEVLSVGLPSSIMTLMSTLSNFTLNKIIASYCNEAVAGMGIAKKIDLMAFAIAQGMTQGALPLIGYNFSAGNRGRMLSAIKAVLLDCLLLALAGTALMFFAAAPITRCFISDAATVEYGRIFLRIVALACPTTALNFLVITIFQATGKRIQPLVLSLLRKGGLDIPMMFAFNRLIGVQGIAWATPLADALALLIAAMLLLPYLKKLGEAPQLSHA